MKSANVYFTGTGVVPGIAIGRAFVISKKTVSLSLRHIEPHEVEFEIKRFEAAVDKIFNHLESIKEKIDSQYRDPGHIIEAQQMMLRDDELHNSVIATISEKMVNVEWALNMALEKWENLFAGVEDDYLRERFSDIHHLINNLQRQLSGDGCLRFDPPPDAIVVADEASAAETIQLGRSAISALITQRGGRTSHSVIIAKAFEIPTIVGVKSITEVVGTGDLLLVDGLEGVVIINPDVKLVQEYRLRMHKNFAREQSLISESAEPAVTIDNRTLHIFANVDFVDEVEAAQSHGAEGIGLYRTEFLFISNIKRAMDEELHYLDAKLLMERWGHGAVTIRTFDLGSDKYALGENPQKETNPALGLRSIRLSLVNRTMFKRQIRGILRASVHCPDVKLRIMFPLISSFEELMMAKEVYYEAYQELETEGHELPDNIRLGSMIELPSAAMQADALATECDFFSIGSNDLIQYSLAVDRNNDTVSHLYNPLNPGVLKMIRNVIQSGEAAGIPVAICGDMATEPISALLLMGMGLKVFSMPPSSIP
ncbi:phosphoenolpyruvate--protein phosphotransferase, partial [Myxococcota bacterium]|nr:phosphoenolpyruvate--protein phosphotransferase [Myxococcota bacterium]